MSGVDDPKGKAKPPVPPQTSTGRSASARSIGEELGDLDFEPDALLDSLLADDTAPKPEPERESKPASEPRESAEVKISTGKPETEPDELGWDEPTAARGPPVASPPELSAATVVAPSSAEGSDAVDDLLAAAPEPPVADEPTPPRQAAPPLEEPKAAYPAAPPPSPAAPPAGEPKPPRPAPPRPPPPPRPSSPPRPLPPPRPSSRPLPRPSSRPLPRPSVRPLPQPSAPPQAEEPASKGAEAQPREIAPPAPPPEPSPPMDSSDEGAMALLDGLAMESRPEPATRDEAASLDEEERAELLGAGVTGERSAIEDLWSMPDWEKHRPASAHLGEQEELGTWRSRAEWMEGEAEHVADSNAKARLLTIASELWAMVGEGVRARQLCGQALALAPTHPLILRQARQLAAADGDWKACVVALDAEAKTAASPDARAHASYLAAEASRLVLQDVSGYERRLEALEKLAPDDTRPHLAALASELSATDQPPQHAIAADLDRLAVLREAALDLARLRGGAARRASELVAIPFEDARRALAEGDRAAAGRAIAQLQSLDGFERAAPWLAAALLGTSKDSRPEAIAHLGNLLQQTGSEDVRRSLAARALEQGDGAAVEAALASTADLERAAFSPADRVALAALTGGDSAAIRPWLDALEADPRLSPLAAAAGSVAHSPDTPVAILCGDETGRTELALGRALASSEAEGADPTVLRAAVRAFSEVHSEHPLSAALALELALRDQDAERVANALSHWVQEDADSVRKRDRLLSSALVRELGGDTDAAKRDYAGALSAEPATEAAVRALLAGAPPRAAASLLTTLAEATADDVHRSLLLTEAALRVGFESNDFGAKLERAAELAPGLPFAYRLGKHHARLRADAGELLAWLRRRRDASDDPMEKALDAIREALLVAETDNESAANLLAEATAARPGDVALHELHERLAPGASSARGAWREQAAASVEGPSKTRLLVEAALEYERADDRESAARASQAAAEADGAFAKTTAERMAAYGASAARLADSLLERAKAAEDAVEKRELYERLSVLDAARGDPSSALLWQSAILEANPRNLHALRHLEQAYIGADRIDELEPIASTLASALDDWEGHAHAMLAARLRAKAGNRAGVREMAELGAKREPPSLWALRTLSVAARESNDDALALSVERQLSERANRAIDSATLALRAAQAAARSGKLAEARALLDRAVELVPEHLVALSELATVLGSEGTHAAAAESLESLAGASNVDAHKLRHWYSAAVLWLDKANDVERGTTALEKAAEIDLRHADIFPRLRDLYVKREERAKLAALLERRLELTTDPEERVALEVTRGKALADVGDHAAAKEALAAALEANPDHFDALDAFAALCVAQGDWQGAEQAWIRLARHATEPERQAEIYRKLGNLYDTDSPNPQRAELSYREVLKRLPNDVGAMERLVHVYGRAGDTTKAIEIQMDLVNRAGTPEEKRDRTIQLAVVQEQILKDRRKAEGTLDKARKAWPQDGAVLRALADFYRRGGETTALNVLLDRAANDARRALGTGRFDASLFEALGTVAELRGGTDAAQVATATLAAIQGEDTPLGGAGLKCGDASFDDLLAPELLSLPLRALLKKAGDALDAAYALDLRAMRAAPLPAGSGALGDQIQQMATAFGIHNIETYSSTSLGPVCLPVSAAPPRLVFGSVLLESDDAARTFLVLRAMKILQARAAALSRTAPIDLWPVLAAFLGVFAPSWQPQGADPKKVAEGQQRIRSALVRKVDDDVPVLALEVIGSIGNRASQLGTAINQWGNRTGLLAIGSPVAALRGVALAGGHLEGPPAEKVERLKWMVRNPEARDLAVFSVSEQYTEARKRAGLG